MNRAVDNFTGNSPEYLRVIHTARMVATTDATVLLSGERGSGRQSLAREIHAVSERRMAPMMVVNCAGLPESVLDSKLSVCFGSDGEKQPSGQQPGTLFLHQVEDLSAASQLRLLHFLLSSEEPGRQPAVRLIASSGCDLPARVDQKRFREDLFYRLHVVPLEVPPLRRRVEDIMLLVKRFTSELSRLHGRKPPSYSVTARNLLKTYSWPGNLSELHNLCERMVILMPGKTIQPENLPLELRRGSAPPSEGAGFLLPAGGIDLLALEGELIRQALGMSGGNRSKAARLLRISRDTLLYRMHKHAIEI